MAWGQGNKWNARPQQVQPPVKQEFGLVKQELGQPSPSSHQSRVVPPKSMGAPESLVVYSSGKDGDEIVVKTLIGTFNEEGTNHGRKAYKRQQKPGEVLDVYLYYWDNRDGVENEGWWFGNQIGGAQVWSHNKSSAAAPPASGWKIPWNGPERKSLMVAPRITPQAGSMQNTQHEAKFQELEGPLREAEKSGKSALEQAKAAAGIYKDLEGMKYAEQLLYPQVQSLAEALKKLREAQKGATGEVLKQFTQIGNALFGTQTQVNQELTRLRAMRMKVTPPEQQRQMSEQQRQAQEKQQQAEEKDRAMLREVVPDATMRTNAAEDAVEKAAITSEMITAAGDDMQEVRAAVAQTEQAATEAQKVIGEARIYLNAKLATCKRFETEKVRQEAHSELTKLQAQLQEAQVKLNPLKTVRQDFVNRTNAQRAVQEVLAKLSPAEVEVDRAEEASAGLGIGTFEQEMLPQAEKAVSTATDKVNAVLAFIEQKKKSATTGMAKEELSKLEDRARMSISRLQQMKGNHKEAIERCTCSKMLKEAADKLQTVAESVAKCADAEGPFLLGVEDLELEQAISAVKACDAAATSANTAVSIARMFIATKLVEARRFNAGTSEEAVQKLKDYQADLDSQTKKLTEIKQATVERKKRNLVREVEEVIQKAEEFVKRVLEAGAIFEDEAKLFALSSMEIRKAADEAVKAEQDATDALKEARRFLTAKQIEAKGKESAPEIGAELMKYQTRLTTAQNEVSKLTKVSTTVEQKLSAKKCLEDTLTRLEAAEARVNEVVALAESFSGGETKEEPDKAGAKGKHDSKKTPTHSKTASKIEEVASDAQRLIKAATRYLDMQMRAQNSAKEEIAKLQPRTATAQERLEKALKEMHAKSEQLTVDALLKECEEAVTEAENAVAQVGQLEDEFVKGSEDLPIDQASDALTKLDGATTAAHSAVKSAQTVLAMKRLSAKRLSSGALENTSDHLNQLQERFDMCSNRLKETKQGMADRKTATIKREVTEKVTEVEEKLAAATEATKTLSEQSVAEITAEEMKASCEKAGKTQTEALKILTATRDLLLHRQRDVKVSLPQDTGLLSELTEMLEKLTKIQGDVDKQRSLLRDQEHKFVAHRLMKDANEHITNLEKKLEDTRSISAPLASEKEEFTATIFLNNVLDGLKAHLIKASKTREDLFKELAEDGKLVEAKFVSVYQDTIAASETEDLSLSEENLKAAFSRLTADGEVTEEVFHQNLQSRYICTSIVSMTEGLAVKGGKTTRKIEPGEVLIAVEEPQKDDSSGLMRVQCKGDKDDKAGYITLAGNQGTVYLEPFTPQALLVKKIERALQDLADTVKFSSKYIDQKIEELKAVRSGPLAQTKQDLLAMKPKVSKVQYTLSVLKKRVAESEKRMKEWTEKEKKRKQDLADKKAGEAITGEVDKVVETCSAEVEKAIAAAEAIAGSKPADGSKPAEQDSGPGSTKKAMDDVAEMLANAMESLDKLQLKIKEHTDSLRSSSGGPFSQARTALVKQKLLAGTLEGRCRKQLSTLKTVRQRLVGDAQNAIVAAVLGHLHSEGKSVGDLFQQLSEGKAEVTSDAMRGYVEKIPNSTFQADQLDLGLERFSHGLTKLTFFELLQEYRRCVKEIAITTACRVKDSKSIRKLALDEIVEVLEAEHVDEDTGIRRVRCRAMACGKEGWVTIRGNQGTAYLEKTGKPYYCCSEEGPLYADFSSSSAELRAVRPGEVLEVLQGPRKEPPQETERIKGRLKDSKTTGWTTLKDPDGSLFFEGLKLLVCRNSIAITTTFNIGEGKSIRKLEAGELLDVLEGPQEDSGRSLVRIKARTRSDDKEGWVTMKGNQGTSYVEETDQFFICKKKTRLESKIYPGSSSVKAIEEGDILKVYEGPTTEIKDGVDRVMVRSLADNSEGWITLRKRNMDPWAPLYKCTHGTTMAESLSIKEAKPVRKLQEGEILEALETPTLETVAGVLRVRVRAEKDGATGFVTVQGNQGTVFLKALPRGL